VFPVGRFAGEPHEDADDHSVRDIRGGIDAVGEQGRAVADDADAGLQQREDGVGRQAEMDGEYTPLLALICFHSGWPHSVFFCLCPGLVRRERLARRFRCRQGPDYSDSGGG
jgi:hypothetical protein